MTDRRSFIKTGVMGAATAIAAPGLLGCGSSSTPVSTSDATCSNLLVPKGNALKITGTFLDEISHDIPHQNWGEKEWDRDFAHMKTIGIDTVIDIRCGYKKFITYPSGHLIKKGCYMPSVDLIDMFCRLADKYDMKFYFGLYDPGKSWEPEKLKAEVDDNRFVIDEVWERYGRKYRSFAGWYISREISKKRPGAAEAMQAMGKHCKEVSDGLPCFISPWISGKKAIRSSESKLAKDSGISTSEHERNWNDILSSLQGIVDAVAFQDGHIDYDELDAFFEINKRLCDRWGMECWTNAETFDRDMPIKFLPIKFDKLRLKLEAAKRAGFDKAITFEFSHFLSPQSVYGAAGNLYNRYREYFGI